MLIHDVTDLSVTLFKLTIDVTHIYIQGFIYGLMLVSWVYFRLWFFPRNIIYRLYAECYSGQYSCPNVNFSMLNMLFAFISGLLCLHIFWFYLMVQGLFRRCRSKKGFVNHVSISGSVNRDTNTSNSSDAQRD
jgi:hypothetical protein